MSVDPATAQHRAAHGGQTYYFCSAGCRSKFVAAPEQYLGEKPAPVEAPAGTIYTCPMHPQIRQVGPGSCPICGMALEPESASLDTPPNPELADMTRRFWIGLGLALPVVVLEMGGHLVGGLHQGGWVDQTLSNWIQLVFATPVVLWAGWPFFVRGWQSLMTRNLNMFTLIALGTGVAYGYSLLATLAPGIFPPAFRGHGGAVAVYFEAASVITVLVLLGQVLELRAREATSGAIKENMLRLRFCTDCQPRTKNGQPAHSTTGDASTNWIQFDSIGSTKPWPPTMCPPISSTTTGAASRAPIQNRRVMSASSGLGASSRLMTSGSSAMPQIGQVPGPSCRTSGCIGQV